MIFLSRPSEILRHAGMLENSKLSQFNVAKIIDCFCIDFDATKTAQLLGFDQISQSCVHALRKTKS